MKKTVISLLLVLVLAAGITVSAMAASPVTPLSATVDVAQCVVPSGVTLDITQAAWAISRMQAAKASLGFDGGTLIAVLDITAVGPFSPGDTVTIHVGVPGFHANGSMAVLHDHGGLISSVPNVSTFEGGFSFTTDTFSPFGFVLMDAGSVSGDAGTGTDAGASTGTGGAATTTPTSPQTGVYSL